MVSISRKPTHIPLLAAKVGGRRRIVVYARVPRAPQVKTSVLITNKISVVTDHVRPPLCRNRQVVSLWRGRRPAGVKRREDSRRTILGQMRIREMK